MRLRPLRPSRLRLLPAAFLVGAALGLPPAAGPALAQTGIAQQALPTGQAPGMDRWRIAVGAGMLFSADYLGSNSYRAIPLAAPEIRAPGDVVFLSFRDGFGTTLLRDGAFSAGLLVRPRFGRDEDDNRATLRGMGDVRIAGEGGVFLAYSGQAWRAAAELRQGFGGHSGLVGDLRLDRVERVRPDLFLNVGPRLTWGGRDFARTYLGVDATQSRRSGYREFRPNDYWFAGIATGATWVMSDRWALTAFGEVGQILGQAADSPLVDRGSATQAAGGLVVTYRFNP